MKRITVLLIFMAIAFTLSADPSFEALHGEFALEVSSDNMLLTDRDKALIDIISLAVQHSESLLKVRIERALDEGINPIEINETLIHITPYGGVGATEKALRIMFEVFSARNIAIEAEDARFDESFRFIEGLENQVLIAGEGMRAFAKMDPIPRTNEYLITDCFGDYYTRSGLDIETREMLTLVILVNMGLDNVIPAHIAGNINTGRSLDFIQEVILECLPYAGYPKILLANSLLATFQN